MRTLRTTAVAAGTVLASAALLTSSTASGAGAAGTVRLCTATGTEYAVTLTVPMRGVRTTIAAPVGVTGPNCTDIPVAGGEPVSVDIDAGTGTTARHRDHAWFVARSGRQVITFGGTAEHPTGDLPATALGSGSTLRIENEAGSTFQAVVLFPARSGSGTSTGPVVPPGTVGARAATVPARAGELAVLYLVSTTRPADRRYLAFFAVRDTPHTLHLRGTWERPEAVLTPTGDDGSPSPSSPSSPSPSSPSPSSPGAATP